LPDGPLSAAHDGLRVAIRLTPGARADRLVAVVAVAGRPVVKASVSAHPEAGRANEALLRLLARCWDLPRRDLSIAAGVASRNKTVHIGGKTSPQQAERLATLIAALPGASAARQRSG
jgi:uncharacterized protein